MLRIERINAQHHFIQKKALKKEIKVISVSTEDQLVDGGIIKI